VSITNSPKHWANRFPWNRKETAARRALEAFLKLAEMRTELGESSVSKTSTRQVLAFLRTLMDREPRELNPGKPEHDPKDNPHA